MDTESVSRPGLRLFRLFRWLAIVTLSVLAVAIIGYTILLIYILNEWAFSASASVVDLEGDGDQDLIWHTMRQSTENTAYDTPAVWTNQGDGRLALREDGPEAGWSSVAGDVDGEGDPDLVVYSGRNLRIDLNQGGAQEGEGGEFLRRHGVNGPGDNFQYGSVVLGDLDSDGRIDGVVLGCCQKSIWTEMTQPNTSWVWLNRIDPAGYWLPESFILAVINGLPVGQGALADLDGDGDLDLFAAVLKPSPETNSAERVLFNDGAGNFSDSGQRLGQGSSVTAALADVDGDGDTDALVGEESRAIIWFNQDGEQGGQPGSFAPSAQELGGEQIRSIFLSDFDADGDPDALIAGREQADVWWNDGHGVFSLSDQRFSYAKRYGPAVADMNGDGWPDIFIGNTRRYKAYFNQGDGTFRSEGFLLSFLPLRFQ